MAVSQWLLLLVMLMLPALSKYSFRRGYDSGYHDGVYEMQRLLQPEVAAAVRRRDQEGV